MIDHFFKKHTVHLTNLINFILNQIFIPFVFFVYFLLIICFSFGKISTISHITGKQIHYISPEMSSYKQALTQAQVSPVFVNMLAGFAQATAEGEFEDITAELESLIGHAPVFVNEYLTTVYGK